MAENDIQVWKNENSIVYGQISPPKYTTDERVGLSTVTGSMIFNTTTNKMQCYDGSNWKYVATDVNV